MCENSLWLCLQGSRAASKSTILIDSVVGPCLLFCLCCTSGGTDSVDFINYSVVYGGTTTVAMFAYTETVVTGDSIAIQHQLRLFS